MCNWDVTPAVNSIIQTNQFLTLVLKAEDNLDSWLWFHSRDQDYSWMGDYRPVLEVSYDEPYSPPQPSPTINITLSDILVIIIVVAMLIASIVGTIIFLKKQKT